jgi:signal transduction histidine kinase
MRADLGAGRVEPEVLLDDLEQVQTSLQVCRRIFGGMIAFARGAERRVGPTDLRQAARNALNVLGDGIGRRGIVLDLELGERLPAPRGSQADLEQLFLNLLQNARDAMSEGGTLTVRAVTDGDRVAVVIADTGRGIPADILPRIHEPFFTTKPDGTGLGLAICRSIVWELGGEIDIASEPGRGTRVELRLPLARPEGSEP